MMGTFNCIYETPCGWCSKWDKKCDKKISEQKIKCNPYGDTNASNKVCVSESDHEWECYGISTVGTNYICKKCGTHKVYPHDYNDKISVTI